MEGGGDSGCASSPRRSGTSVCVFFSSRRFALPIFPSLRLSPLLVSIFPVNFLLLPFLLPSLPLFSYQPSPLLLHGSQRRSGVLWRWRAGTVAAGVVLLLFFCFVLGFSSVDDLVSSFPLFFLSFFFLLPPLFSPVFFCFCPSLSRSPCQYLPGFLVSTVSVPSLPSFCFSQKNCCFPPFGLSFLSQKNCRTLSLSRFPSSFFFKTKSFQLSFFSLKKTSPPFVILLSGRSLLSPPKNCCFSFGFSSLAPCFVSVSPLLLLLAAAGDKAK